jgi:hypothetical protein
MALIASTDAARRRNRRLPLFFPALFLDDFMLASSLVGEAFVTAGGAMPHAKRPVGNSVDLRKMRFMLPWQNPLPAMQRKAGKAELIYCAGNPDASLDPAFYSRASGFSPDLLNAVFLYCRIKSAWEANCDNRPFGLDLQDVFRRVN